MHFSVRPTPETEESLIGFILRSVLRNGFMYLASALAPSYINKLIRLQKLPFQIKGLTLPKVQIPQFEAKTPLFKHHWMLNPKVCLQCIEQNNIIKSEVQNPFLNRCSTHNTLMIDKCQACNVPLEWDVELLQGKCTNSHCGVRLTELSDKDLPYLSTQEVADCLLASILISNNDISYIKPTQFATIKDYQQRILKGHDFLSQNRKVKVWMLSLLRNQSQAVPRSFTLVHIRLLLENIDSKWSFRKVVQQLKDVSYAPPHSAINPMEMNASQARQLIGVDTESLQRLVEHKCIAKIGNSRFTYNSIVNLAPLINFLEKSTFIEGRLPLSEQGTLLQYYSVTMADVLIAIKNNKLSVGFAANHNLSSSIYCNHEQLAAFGKEHLDSKHEDLIDREKAKEILKCTTEQLARFHKEGKLKHPKWFKGSNQLCILGEVIQIREKEKLISSSFS